MLALERPGAPELDRARGEECGSQRLPRNDQPKGDLPRRWDEERMIGHRAVGRDAVHAEYVLHGPIDSRDEAGGRQSGRRGAMPGRR